MSTLAQMRSRIADDLNRSDLNVQIDKSINRAISFYEKEEFWFRETTSTFSTIINQEGYGTADSLPSDILEIDYAKLILSSTVHQELEKRPFAYIQQLNAGRATGDPTDYAWYQNKLYLYLIPNSVKTITLFYRKSYSVLSADSDTNDFTVYAEDLIEARASWWIYSRILKDYDAANIAKAEENEVLQALREKSRQYQSTNLITATEF